MERARKIFRSADNDSRLVFEMPLISAQSKRKRALFGAFFSLVALLCYLADGSVNSLTVFQLCAIAYFLAFADDGATRRSRWDRERN
jgi:hypothetical protein